MNSSAQAAARIQDAGSGVEKRAHARVSLLTKGIVAFVALLVYVVIIGFIVAQQRSMLRTSVEQQRATFDMEEALGRVSSTLAYAILNVNEAYYTANSRATPESIVLDVEAVQAGLHQLLPHYPKIQPRIGMLDASIVLIREDRGRESLIRLRDGLHELVAQLDDATREVRDRHLAVSESFNTAYHAITLVLVGMGLIGALVFGGVVLLFFSRLVRDVRKLQTRALEVVKGYRGGPLEVSRRDELGALMASINNMQAELREREGQLEVARQRRFHHEKMAAIGSLAAAIAHEVNNPISAITGIAEVIQETQNSQSCAGGRCRPALILEQTRRISNITRQLADMTAPHSPEPQLVDLNALVKSTCAFVAYDKRFGNVEFVFDLDSQVQAIRVVTDHLTQILMNLLINAADATAGIVGEKAKITVHTRTGTAQVELVVEDNGCGMDQAILANAFEEAFTTKPPGQGSGLGLFMCRSLIEGEGGSIRLESEVARGTRAIVRLPTSTRGGAQ